MSIINDALNKASQQKEQSQAEAPQPPQPSQDISAHRSALKSANKKTKPQHGLVTYIFSAIFMLGCVVFLFMTITGKSLRPAPKAPAPANIPPAAPVQDLQPAPAPVSPHVDAIQNNVQAPPATMHPVNLNTQPVATPAPVSTQPSLPEYGPEFNEADYTITGIVQGEGDPMAIINGSVYLVGDEIGNAKVVEISQQKVILEYLGKRFEIKVR